MEVYYLLQQILPHMGGGVIRCKDSNGNTYRPLEYKSQSGSATYYTSAVNSEGLSSTTALTCESTTSTEYQTAGNYIATYMQYNVYNGGNVKSTYTITSCTSIRTVTANGDDNEKWLSFTFYNAGGTSSKYDYNGGYSSGTLPDYRSSINTYFNHAYLVLGNKGAYPAQSVDFNGFTKSCSFSRTGKQSLSYYITLNCNGTNTTNTIYHTCESTSGYSGVSSSSSESSGWE